ncbi:MAG: hypothetical protein EOO24_67415 [Comamonadaceae bacterium]|nr:MAG: hypothetical protein EOO24_67415 [Comamonadaceae bacterium]
MTALPAFGPCPCCRQDARGRLLPLAECCGRYLDGAFPAPDAESLMRSRYSAFVREDAAYLLASWHVSSRPAGIVFEPGVKWLGLEVRSHRRLDDDHAEVVFVARSRLAGRAHRLHERSRFVRSGGHWFYLEGDIQ